MAENYVIYIKDPKSGEVKKVSFNKEKQEEEVNVNEDITIPVKIGDTILMGKFRNKKVVVKTIEKDEHGMPIINGKKVVNFRKLKEGIEVTFDGEDKQEEEIYAPPFKEPKKKKKNKELREPQKVADKDVGELLNEIIDANEINVDALKVKNRLCPKVWDSDEEMNPEVRQALLKNALEFIKFSKLENARFEDIILTGSMANYNWHEGSDLDVHVLMDYDQISDDNEFVDDYFKTKKNLWAERLPIQVKDHDVELYVQDTNEPHTSTGVYSLLNDKWLTKPIKSMVAIDVPNIRAKTIDFMNQIDNLLDSEVGSLRVEDIEKIMDKLRAYRKAGLEDEGEFSTENLVFKMLRNTGYLEQLADLKQHILVNQLTLENVSAYDPAIISEDGFRENLKGWVRKGTLGLGVIVGLLAAGMSAQEMVKEYGIAPELIKRAESFMANSYEELGLSDKTVKLE